MIAIIGATGRVGSSTAAALRAAESPVRAIVRDTSKASKLQDIGCEVAVADLQDARALAQAIGDADAVQVIAPLAPTAADPVADLYRSVDSVVAALGQVRPKRVLAISDYGAHITDDIGIPSIFREFERRLRSLDSQVVILRSAEHLHNWGRAIHMALDTGTLPSFQIPLDMEQPMIAAQDLGRTSAELLLQPGRDRALRIVHAEGPRRYSANDVAIALGTLAGQPIKAREVPPEHWSDAFAGTPPSLARLVIRTNQAKNAGGLVDVEPKIGEVRRGTTELIDALRPLLAGR